MKIFVCVKQVPDTETKIKLQANLQGIESNGIKWVMNPYDEFALEEALKFREANAGTQVFALTVGPKARAADVLRTALAVGADEAILIDAPEGLDNFSTAKALAQAISQEGGGKVVFTGKVSIDDNASAVSQMLAEFMNVPHATVVSKFSSSGENFMVERDVDGGSKEVIQLMSPAVVGANKGLNSPRYASLPGIMKAKKKTIKELDLAALGVSSADSKVTLSQFSLPPEKPAVKLLSGDSSHQASELVHLLRDEAKVL